MIVLYAGTKRAHSAGMMCVGFSLQGLGIYLQYSLRKILPGRATSSHIQSAICELVEAVYGRLWIYWTIPLILGNGELFNFCDPSRYHAVCGNLFCSDIGLD